MNDKSNYKTYTFSWSIIILFIILNITTIVEFYLGVEQTREDKFLFGFMMFFTIYSLIFRIYISQDEIIERSIAKTKIKFSDISEIKLYSLNYFYIKDHKGNIIHIFLGLQKYKEILHFLSKKVNEYDIKYIEKKPGVAYELKNYYKNHEE